MLALLLCADEVKLMGIMLSAACFSAWKPGEADTGGPAPGHLTASSNLNGIQKKLNHNNAKKNTVAMSTKSIDKDCEITYECS